MSTIWEPIDFHDLAADDEELANLRDASRLASEITASFYVDANPDRIRLCRSVEAPVKRSAQDFVSEVERRVDEMPGGHQGTTEYFAAFFDVAKEWKLELRTS